MAIFRRRNEAPDVDGRSYTRFRPFVREDFSACCAYCLMYERAAGGAEAFELDHFKPKSKKTFRGLVDDYFNLYYACHVRNRFKAARWPSREQELQGWRFLDFCRDLFDEHFEATSSGRWLPRTAAARYTEKRLRLNRPHLIEIRCLLTEIADYSGLGPVDWNRPMGSTLAPLFDRLSTDSS